MATRSTNYRQLNDELNDLLEELQGGDIDIDDAVTKYERGMKIVGELKQYLKDTHNKVTKITAND
jgi:exodeoxyribonuclease VII small subunit